MLIIHCSFTRKSLLVSTWFLSPWLGETANNYFRLFGENILSEETEKVGSQWALQSSDRLSTPLHSPPPAKINSGNRKVPHQQISHIARASTPRQVYVDTSPH